MIRKAQRFWRLPPAERRVLLRAWTLLLLFDLGLRTLPFSWVKRRASRPVSWTSPLPVSPQRMAALVAAAGRNHLYSMTCLRQALALQRLLGRCGFSTELKLGVRKKEGVLEAHAWLVKDGFAIEPAENSADYAPLETSS